MHTNKFSEKYVFSSFLKTIVRFLQVQWAIRIRRTDRLARNLFNLSTLPRYRWDRPSLAMLTPPLKPNYMARPPAGKLFFFFFKCLGRNWKWFNSTCLLLIGKSAIWLSALADPWGRAWHVPLNCMKRSGIGSWCPQREILDPPLGHWACFKI